MPLTGNYVQSGVNSAINMKLGGTPGSGLFDKLLISGSATLSGALNVTTINGFTPHPRSELHNHDLLRACTGGQFHDAQPAQRLLGKYRDFGPIHHILLSHPKR